MSCRSGINVIRKRYADLLARRAGTKKDDRKRWGGGVPALYGKEGEHMEAGLKQQFSIRLNYYALSGLLKHSAVSIQPTNQQLNTPKRHKG